MKMPVVKETEQGLLGAMILNNYNILIAIQRGLKPKDFYTTSHQQIFEVLTEKHKEGLNIDLIILSNILKEKKIEIGGATYLTSLCSCACIDSLFNHYVSKIQEYSQKRRILIAIFKIVNQINEVEWKELKKIISEELLFVYEGKDGEIDKTSDILIEEALERLKLQKGKNIGLQAGLPIITNRCPIIPQEVIVLGGAPGVGKSSLCLTLIHNIARTEKKTVLFFSCEMAREMTLLRLASISMNEPFDKIRRGECDKEISDEKKETLKKVIIDKGNISDIDEIIASIRLYHKKYPDLCFVAIDHIGFLSGKRQETRNQELTEIISKVCRTAKELNLAIIIITHLKQDAIDKRHTLRDIRESNSLSQDADIVWFLYQSEKKSKNDEIELIVAKQRFGKTFKEIIKFDEEKSMFYQSG